MADSHTEAVDVDAPPVPSQAWIQKAIKSNPPGVNIVVLGSMEGTPSLAGYLKFPTTKELRAFTTKAMESDYWKQFVQAREIGFGVNGKTEKAVWTVKILFNYITANPTLLSAAEFESGLPLDRTKWKVSDLARGYASFIVTMHAIITNNPDSFPVTVGSENASRMLSGIEPENWYRAYLVICHLWRERNESRKALKAADGKAKKVQNKIAEEPYFLTDADRRHVASAEGATLTEGSIALEGYLQRDGEISEDSGDEDDVDPKESKGAAVDEALALFERSFRNVPSSLQLIDKENNMPRLTDTAIRQTLANLGKRATVLYPHTECSSHAAEASSAETTQFAENTVQKADIEGIAGKSADMDDASREEFWELQRCMNSISSRPAPYDVCCQDLGFDPQHPMIGHILLKPWQVTGAWWILYQWRFGLGSALLADDVGLGKTIETLTALQRGVDLAKETATVAVDESKLTEVNIPSTNLGLQGPFRPTLIICPASAFGVWKDELKLFPDIELKLWAGDQGKAAVHDRHLTLGTRVEDLLEYTRKYESTSDASVALHVVLTTYQTFHGRTLFFNGVAGKGKGNKQTGKARDDNFDDEDDEEAELSMEELSKLSTKVEQAFGVVIADEAHKLKSQRTRTHQAVSLVKPERLALVTATPTINRTADLYGALCLMWANMRPEIRLDIDDAKSFLEEEDYAEISTRVTSGEDCTDVTAANWAEIVPLINPRAYARIMNRERTLSTATASRVLPAILNTVQLRRVKGQEMWIGTDRVVIGGDIPPYKVVTVELEMGRTEAERYMKIYETTVGLLAKATPAGRHPADSSPTTEGAMNMRAHRQLCHATLHSGLNAFQNRTSATTKKIATWNEQSDYGYNFFHRLTRLDPTAPLHRDRVGAALSIAGPSVKLQWLAGLVHDNCYRDGRNLIIFTSWPSTQWLIEMYLTIIGVPVLSIRAAHSRMARTQTAELFNDSSTKASVLITSLKCGSTSLNLQKNCSDVVFMEIPESANSAAQAIGRVHRISQTRVQNIYMATTNYTYDQPQQARAAKKMYSQIAGSSDLKVTEKELTDAEALWVDSLGKNTKLSDEDKAQEVLEFAQLRKVTSLYTKTFGQRSPRDRWDNTKDLTLKDTLESETGADGATKINPRPAIRKIALNSAIRIRRRSGYVSRSVSLQHSPHPSTLADAVVTTTPPSAVVASTSGKQSSPSLSSGPDTLDLDDPFQADSAIGKPTDSEEELKPAAEGQGEVAAVSSVAVVEQQPAAEGQGEVAAVSSVEVIEQQPIQSEATASEMADTGTLMGPAANADATETEGQENDESGSRSGRKRRAGSRNARGSVSSSSSRASSARRPSKKPKTEKTAVLPTRRSSRGQAKK